MKTTAAYRLPTPATYAAATPAARAAYRAAYLRYLRAAYAPPTLTAAVNGPPAALGNVTLTLTLAAVLASE